MNSQRMVRSTGNFIERWVPDMAASIAERLATTPRRKHLLNSTRVRRSGIPITFRFGRTGLRWGDSGPIVLAIHGWEGRPQQFSAIGEALAERGLRLVALTGPGHAPGDRERAHPGAFVDALFEAASELGNVQALIGHSMGGGAALLAASRGLSVQRIVTVASPAGYRGVLHRIADGLGLNNLGRAGFLARMEARTGFRLDETEPVQLMPRLDVPVLIAHDRDDSVIPFDEALELARHSNRARTLHTEGLGHGRILSDAATIRRIVDFCSSIQAGEKT
ncbi:MAG TPA: alpha/beta fold hydrolase [Wenzhouxiangellaceae bacterium]|nr:alpha/beta fold hydrolase [Wenzhouxiangellaceae bacterium]